LTKQWLASSPFATPDVALQEHEET
jgi:hypothetical protein